ncbi:MAG: hypothetical protein JWP08_1354 [Bryobacterales bacterium]|nr:hypothetical protein [Bryobacterales bacterium]
MTESIDLQDKPQKFAFFLLGITVPIAGYFVWSKTMGRTSRKDEIDQAHDITVEDSFPASDPPSAW